AQPGEVAVGKARRFAHHLAARELDEARADAVAGAAAPAVEHHPDAVLLVEADLDEVVAAAERAGLPGRADVGDLPVAVDYALLPRGERAPGAPHRLRRLVPRADARALPAAVGHRRLDLGAQRLERVGEPIGAEARALRDHAAADVDADRGGDD